MQSWARFPVPKTFLSKEGLFLFRCFEFELESEKKEEKISFFQEAPYKTVKHTRLSN